MACAQEVWEKNTQVGMEGNAIYDELVNRNIGSDIMSCDVA